MTDAAHSFGWPFRPCGELIDLFDNIRVPLSSRERQQRAGPYPYYGAQGVIDHIDDYLFEGRYLLVAEDGENLRSRKLPLAMVANGKFWVNNHAHVLRAKASVADDLFLVAALNWVNIQPFITGAAQPKLSQEHLRRIPIPVPPLSIQRHIAAILSLYDDLISNNLRRIKILEAMARAIYREWFVHFRFPGHENVALVDSPLGRIPEGWEARPLSELTSTQYGYTASTNQEPVGPQYLRGMDLNKRSFIDWSQVPYCAIAEGERAEYSLRRGDVVVIRMADPGKAGIVEQDASAVFASYLIRITPKDDWLSPYFLFHLLDSPEYGAYISGTSTGTTRKSASAGVVTGFRFALPPRALVQQFEAHAGSIRRLLTILLQQNANLRATRDLLLPRLMSGQLTLPEAEAAATASL